MLERPDIQDRHIISHLQAEYGLHAKQLNFLPLGADVNTAVFRVATQDGEEYFLKLRKDDFDEISVLVPQFLKTQGIRSIIAPLQTREQELWTPLDAYKLILYPFIAGKDGYEMALSDRQWQDFGAALRAVHAAQVPPALARIIPQESFSPQWRDLVREFQAQVESMVYDDPIAARLATFMKGKRREITRLVARTEQLANVLRSRSHQFVLCHYDIHAGNLLLGADDALYIVDWDNPSFAPKERDLILIGGSPIWSNTREEALFYQGYGPAQIDATALAYYRCERIVQDIAEFCKQLLLTTEGGEDREQAYEYFTGQFLPNHEVEIAFKTEQL